MDSPSGPVSAPDVDNLCRACFTPLEDMDTPESINIFEMPCVLNKLSACISTEFTTHEKGSKNLCLDCYERIDELYEFREMCIRSIRLFAGMQYNEKTTISDEVIKEEYELNDQAVFSNVHAPIVLAVGVHDLTKLCNEDAMVDSKPAFDVKIKKEPVFDENDGDGPTLINASESTSSSLDEDIGSQDAINSMNKSRTGIEIDAVESTASDTAKEFSQSIVKKRQIYRCDICPKTFKFEQFLKAHIRQHKSLMPFPCTYEACDKSFTTLQGLKQHLICKHDSPSMKYICDQEGCDKSYAYEDSLRRHKKLQHNIETETKLYICEICSKEYKTFFILKSHMNTHQLEPTADLWVCEAPNCSRTFRYKYLMLRHMEKHHLPSAKHACPRCDYRTHIKWNLTIHMRRPCSKFHCLHCTQIFHSIKDMANHRRTIHPSTCHKCRYCPKLFASRGSLYRHEVTVHKMKDAKIEVFCSACGKGFMNKFHLRSHTKYCVSHLKNSAEGKKNVDNVQELPDEDRMEYCESNTKTEPLSDDEEFTSINASENISSIFDKNIYSEDAVNSMPKSSTSNEIDEVHVSVNDLKPEPNVNDEHYSVNSINSTASEIVETTKQDSAKKRKKFYCVKCPETFKHEHLFIAHCRKHEGLKPFLCSYEGCVKSFTTLYTLKEHRRNHDRPMHICDEEGCGRQYEYSYNLKVHKKKSHNIC